MRFVLLTLHFSLSLSGSKVFAFKFFQTSRWTQKFIFANQGLFL